MHMSKSRDKKDSMSEPGTGGGGKDEREILKERHKSGVQHFKSGNYDSAAEVYTRIIEISPDDAHAYSNRGSCHAKMGDLEKAVQDYNEAIRLSPLYSNAYYNRGQCLRRKGDFPAAAADFTTSFSQIPP